MQFSSNHDPSYYSCYIAKFLNKVTYLFIAKFNGTNLHRNHMYTQFSLEPIDSQQISPPQEVPCLALDREMLGAGLSFLGLPTKLIKTLISKFLLTKNTLYINNIYTSNILCSVRIITYHFHIWAQNAIYSCL